MVKTKLEMEQIIAGALLLSFDNISSLDVSLLVEDFLRKNPNYDLTAINSEHLNKYIKSENDNVSLKDGLTLESYVPENESNLEKRLKQIAGSCIRKYIETFDIEEFMLRKIKHFSSIPEDCIDNFFCKKQQDALKKIDEKGYLTTVWKDDCIYDDYRETRLSGFGKLRLFKIDYAEELKRFTEELKSLRYDTSLLDDFLIKQDLDLPAWSILNTEKIDEFCNDYDRANLEPGASRVCFERLESEKGTILNETGKKLMQDMLSVWDDGHCIYICHPNHIFAGANPLTNDVRTIKNINWGDINIQKLFDVGDYKTFIEPDCTEAFKYVHGRLGHQIMQEVKKGNKETAVSYLAIVEKYHFDYEDYYLVRGIIRGDYKGYSIAFNPEYKRVIPISVWDKSLRFSGKEVPEEYCRKRKK